ncbi:3-dehydroquinate synthase family protein [Streptomyces sp. ALI-76-A]|jgi:5-deoxy-5-amino-3-dehydroquinate synthase|uniref:3-dehydroquinate synthase family protein n=1 Tax=Streptomyces sp. ALI-76-A TaxID=3025736 RepID=UPI00256EC9CB|nr:3-dehydroquinate synthase family protein [Streptomyces sp. ALI-76-A]MDL5205423.1 3-dehydroquinate synthase family protein [Streptomyces sp. ALI-76-A]
MASIPLRLKDHSYDVLIGPGVRTSLADIVRRLGAGRAVVVSARPEEWVPDTGVETLLLPARDGEQDKTFATVETLCGEFVRFGLTRSDVVVSCGGGTTTDVVGLAAALYHRGVAVVHLPTSLLAQVDASVGGKTAVNLPAGKNLVGAYWQPSAVLCDTDYLSTLPRREMRNGYGEIARCHFIGAPDLRAMALPDQIAASVRLKARVVEADERDAGLRHILNYGHTLGHALEKATAYTLRHGEAVAIGTVFAGRLAGALGRVGRARVAEHEDVVRHYGLPAALPVETDPADLLRLMRHDKKAITGLAFVLDGPTGAELVGDVPQEVVAHVLGQMPRAPLADLVDTPEPAAASAPTAATARTAPVAAASAPTAGRARS